MPSARMSMFGLIIEKDVAQSEREQRDITRSKSAQTTVEKKNAMDSMVYDRCRGDGAVGMYLEE